MNPFYLSPHTTSRYFCDRERETNEIIDYLVSGSNVTLISPRRYGKTGLIYHVFDTLKERGDDYEMYYVDIYSARSIEDMISLMAESIYETLDGRPAAKSFIDVLKSVRPVLTTDPFSGMPHFSFTFQTDTEKRYTLKSLLSYLEKRKKKVIVAIDEFQQIREFEGIETEALLRTYIQPLNNVRFIFSGSKRHIMSDMFIGEKSPFYESAAVYPIGKINTEKYSSFIKRCFSEAGKTITDDAVEYILEWTLAHTYYTQFLCNRVFSLSGEKADMPEVKAAIRAIMEENTDSFLERRALITGKQWNYLVAIAKEGSVSQPYSNSFLQKYRLGAPSSVDRILEALVEKELVLVEKSPETISYRVYNVFLSRWMEGL